MDWVNQGSVSSPWELVINWTEEVENDSKDFVSISLVAKEIIYCDKEQRS